MAYRVTATTVVVKIGGGERYLSRGAIVPDAASNVAHLVSVGLVAQDERPAEKPAEQGEKPARAARSSK